ncbi:MAG: hypothetical protein IRZ03_15990 [Acidobacterium ailaaui]|nr:hypothetical protein [Pseudacidobacterium ailaaui]
MTLIIINVGLWVLTVLVYIISVQYKRANRCEELLKKLESDIDDIEYNARLYLNNLNELKELFNDPEMDKYSCHPYIQKKILRVISILNDMRPIK